jgi:Mg/Co/Ni transporter MgtE
MDHRYAPPRAEVKDAAPAAMEVDPSIDPAAALKRARIHIGLASTLLFLSALGLFLCLVGAGEWRWCGAAVIFVLAGGLLLIRSRWARFPMWLSAATYVGAWASVVIPVLEDSWETDPTVAVAVCVVTVFPFVGISAYCVYVAHAYTHRPRVD